MRTGFVNQVRPALRRAEMLVQSTGLKRRAMLALTIGMALPPGSSSIRPRFTPLRAVSSDTFADAITGPMGFEQPEIVGANGVFTVINSEHFTLTEEGVLKLKLPATGNFRSTFTTEMARLPAGVKILALRRMRLWWMAPWWGSSTDSLPEETQFVLVKLPTEDGQSHSYAAIIPLVDGSYRSTLSGGRGGLLSATIESGSDFVPVDRQIDVALVARGSDPYATLKSAFDLASARLGSFRTLEHKIAPPILDWFGWCTWDAFYFKVHGEGIRQGLKTLSDGGTPAKMLIIDDGWQDVKTDAKYDESTTTTPTSRRGRFFANVFQRLQTTIDKYYRKHVFHAPLGSPHLKLFELLSNSLLKVPLMFWTAENDPGSKRLVSPEASRRFLNTLGGKSGQNDAVSELKTFINKVKDEDGVKFVYAWHHLLGYWGGEAPDPKNTVSSKAPAKAPKTNLRGGGVSDGATSVQSNSVLPRFSDALLRVEPQLQWEGWALHHVGVRASVANSSVAEDAERLYSGMHGYLAAAGVDGVKCDGQAMAPLVGNTLGGGPDAARAYVQTMQKSVLDNFGSQNNCINCMCHPSDVLLSFKEGCIARSSDDFWPRDPPSHTVHVASNVYNTLFMSQITFPDWDMFQSVNPSAGLHAVARAVGGCQVYVSDHPGEHNFDLLKRLVLPDGHVLRATLPGRPTVDTIFEDVAMDGVTASKVWNLNKASGIVGAFNLQGNSWDAVNRRNAVHDPNPRPVTAHVAATDVHGLSASADDRFVVFVTEWTPEGELRRSSMRPVLGTEVTSVELPARNSAIFTFVRAQGGAGGGWALVGLSDMMNAGGAVLSSTLTNGADGAPTAANAEFIGFGTLLAWSAAKPSSVRVEGGKVPWTWDEGAGALRIETPTTASEKASQARRLEVLF